MMVKQFRFLPQVALVFSMAASAFAAEPAKDQPAKDQTAKDKPATKPAKDIQAEFGAMLKSPTRENFLAVQESLAADKAYSPYSVDLRTMGDLLKEKKYGEVEATYKKTWPNLMSARRRTS